MKDFDFLVNVNVFKSLKYLSVITTIIIINVIVYSIIVVIIILKKRNQVGNSDLYYNKIVFSSIDSFPGSRIPLIFIRLLHNKSILSYLPNLQRTVNTR